MEPLQADPAAATATVPACAHEPTGPAPAVPTPEVPAELEAASMDVKADDGDEQPMETAAAELKQEQEASAAAAAASTPEEGDAKPAPQQTPAAADVAAAGEVQEEGAAGGAAAPADMPLDALLLLAGLAGGDLAGAKEGARTARCVRQDAWDCGLCVVGRPCHSFRAACQLPVAHPAPSRPTLTSPPPRHLLCCNTKQDGA